MLPVRTWPVPSCSCWDFMHWYTLTFNICTHHPGAAMHCDCIGPRVAYGLNQTFETVESSKPSPTFSFHLSPLSQQCYLNLNTGISHSKRWVQPVPHLGWSACVSLSGTSQGRLPTASLWCFWLQRLAINRCLQYHPCWDSVSHSWSVWWISLFSLARFFASSFTFISLHILLSFSLSLTEGSLWLSG